MGGSDPSEQRVIDGSAWRDFCQALERAGQVILEEGSPEDSFERAEGLRYLTRLTRAAFETFIEDCDPGAPEFLRTCNETVKMGADNPDNYYQNAPVSSRFRYRLQGMRGTVHYLGFGTMAGNYGASGSMPPTGYLDDSEMLLDEDGRFEVILSVDRPEGAANWLPLARDTKSLVIRQTFLDRKTEKRAQLDLVRIDEEGNVLDAAPRPVSARGVDHGLQASAMFVQGCAKLFHRWTRGFMQAPNTLPLFDSGEADQAGGVPHIAYFHGYWELAPDEALVIDATPPDCDYWNFQLNNHWMESLDYRYFDVVINKHSAVTEPNGSVRVIVAHEDPGHPNWIETCDHERGTMCWRWVRADEHPEPQCRVMKLAELTGG